MTQSRALDRIVRDPKIMVGKPTVRGTRIPVATVLGHLSGTLDFADLFEAHPSLTREDVMAVLDYARRAVEADSRQTIASVVAERAQA
jgi:uncharacterized protein (DUF433 family)